MFVETIKSRRGDKVYSTFLVRETFRLGSKVHHRTLANLSKLPPQVVATVRQALAGEGSGPEPEYRNSREYGASRAMLELLRSLGLDRILYSRKEQWREDVQAMIVGRIVFQGSKLSLTNLYEDTSLWELCAHPAHVRPEVEECCYQALDRLLDRQRAIEKQLAARHLEGGCLILYDLTNFWLEGEYAHSQLAAFGRSKSGRGGKKQIAVGLLTNAVGCPVAVEVFAGNTSDQATLWEQARRLAEDFGVKEIILAGDRGMLTPKRIAEVNAFGFHTLTALTHPQIARLLEARTIQIELFDEKMVTEVLDPDNGRIRYLLCRNPTTAAREGQTRRSLLEKVKAELGKTAAVTRKRPPEKVAAKVGALLQRYKVGKFVEWNVTKKGALAFVMDEEKIAAEEALDGCYVVRTDVPVQVMDKNQAVKGYRSLSGVEKAFRNLKTVVLEMRPVYHKLDQRIRAHVFLCMLAYYVLWHATQRLQPLFENDGAGPERRWSLEVALERLKSLRREDILIAGTIVGLKHSVPDPEQQKILDLLGVKMP